MEVRRSRLRARRVGSDHCGGVGSARRAGWVGLDVVRSNVSVGDCVAISLLVVHSPLLFSRVDLRKVTDAGCSASGLSCLNEVRDGDRRENPDNQDDNHNFDEGKASVSVGVSLHIGCTSPV